MTDRTFSITNQDRTFEFTHVADDYFNITTPMDSQIFQILNKYQDNDLNGAIEIMEQVISSALNGDFASVDFQSQMLWVDYRGEATAEQVAAAINESIQDASALSFNE